MKSHRIIVIVLCILSICMTGCIVCDAPMDDPIEFRLIGADNKDLYLNHLEFNKDSLLISSSVNIYSFRPNYSLRVSGTDSFYSFSTRNISSLYSNRSSVYLKINDVIIDTLIISAKETCGRCGCSHQITDITHDGISIKGSQPYKVTVH